VKTHVSAVFHGHDHLYDRQILDGISYIEVAQPSHPAGNTALRMATEYGYLTGKILGSPGYVRVSVAHDGATVEYVRSAASNDSNEQLNHTVGDSFKISPPN